MGGILTTVLLDTHVIAWWSTDPGRLSETATRTLADADELAVASITWYELAWLAHRGRIGVPASIRFWLSELARQVRTVAITPSIADAAASLPASFPKDPADRLIYATAIECGWPLVTKDERMRTHRHPRQITVW